MLESLWDGHRRHGSFSLTDHKLVRVDEHVRGLARVFLSTDRLHHDLVLGLHRHLMVIEAPPAILFVIKDKTVVVARISEAVVHKNRVQVVRLLAVVTVRVFNLTFKFADSLLDLLFPLLNVFLKRGEHTEGANQLLVCNF